MLAWDKPSNWTYWFVFQHQLEDCCWSTVYLLFYTLPLNTGDPLQLWVGLQDNHPIPSRDQTTELHRLFYVCCYLLGLLISSSVQLTSLFASHTLKDYTKSHTFTQRGWGLGQRGRMRSHTNIPAVGVGSANLWERQLEFFFAALFTTAADSLAGKHERRRKCVTQFCASSLPRAAEPLFRVKTTIPEVEVGPQEETSAVGLLDIRSHFCRFLHHIFFFLF